MLTTKKLEWIQTDTGNKISRKADLQGYQNIVLKSRTIIESGSTLRGDLRKKGAGPSVAISIGAYSRINSNVVITPPIKDYKGEPSYYPIKIGDYCEIGRNTSSEAVSIGNHSKIGGNCRIGAFVIVKECCEILDNSVVPPYTVLPPFTKFSGIPSNHC